MTKSIKSQCIALALGALIAVTSWADSSSTEIRLRTALSGGAIAGRVPSGNADFRSEPARNRSRLNVEVENVNLANGTVLDVLVSNVKAGEKRPAILFCAGTAGTKKGNGALYANRFVKEGFVVLAFDYRGWGESDCKLMMTEAMPKADADGPSLSKPGRCGGSLIWRIRHSISAVP